MRKILFTILGIIIAGISFGQTLELSNSTLNFGITDTAQAHVSDSIYIKNTGTQPLSLDSLQEPAIPFSLVNAPSNSISIAAGDSIPLEVQASRAMNPGFYESQVPIFTNDVDTVLTTQIQLTAAPSAYTFNEVDYWIGNGTKTAMLVVDFNDSAQTETYAWGYRYSGQATAEDMLNDIAAADTNLDVTLVGGFLNTIQYKSQKGTGGSPHYWGTWSGTNNADWSMNMGISTTLTDSAWFGCSYTDFAPALAPGLPQPAHVLDTTFVFDDVDYWMGSGNKKTMLVVDFNDSTNTPSYAWGVRFDSLITAQEILQKVANADTAFNLSTGGGFLNDISYKTHAGISGSPNYWSTWKGTNILDWEMNSGITDTIRNGQWFGCSYTDFSLALMPSAPVPAQEPYTGIARNKNANLSIYPNPAIHNIHIEMPGNWKQAKVRIFNMQGQMVLNQNYGGKSAVNISKLESGLYLVQMTNGKEIYRTRFLKH